jgi:hypothetical protein
MNISKHCHWFILPQSRGFALIVTLSMMILLTIIALGLLTLSGISLRSSSQGDAMATARSNARMALMLAIGDLQKYAGLDQRVTARADLLDKDVHNPRFTGVWRSWDIKATSPPTASDYDKPERDRKFLGWLASCPDGLASSNIGFIAKVPTSPVILWGEGSLGKGAPSSDIVKAEKLPTSGKSRGALAWAVMDEGIKVRINTPYEDKAATRGMQTAQLGSGERPNTSSLLGLEKLDRAFFERGSAGMASIDKGISRLNLQLAAESLAAGTQTRIKSLAHDVTPFSAGILTDTAIGGLKEDFNLLTNAASLPENYSNKGVYESLLGMTGPSDPKWESFRQYAGIYKDGSRFVNNGGLPLLRAQGPQGWMAASGSDPTTGRPGTANLAPPPGTVLMPTIAKVQIFFSLLTRDIYHYAKPSAGIVGDMTPKPPGTKSDEITAQLHPPWGSIFAGSSYDYLLHMIYTPVVTLHNPYNVALEFNELKVIFGNVPFALQVFRNGQAQTNGLAPLDTMYYQGSEKGEVHKRFGMTLKTNRGTPSSPLVGSTTFRLLPGEVMMFSPYIDPNRIWANEHGGSRVFFDYDSNLTMNIDGLPGWRGDGIGFDLDSFCPIYKGLRVSSVETENGVSMERSGCIAARAQDEFSVKFAPLSVPELSKNKYSIEIFVTPPNSSSSVSSGLIEMDYESPEGLQNFILGENGTITYPKTGTINAMAMHSHSTTPIKEIATAKPFAVLSAQAKTTTGGMLQDGEDGKLATKPWSFGHGVIGVSSQKVLSQHPASQSHEIVLQRLDNGTNNLLQFDPLTGRGNFITGLTGGSGLKFGVLYDVPLAPLQTLASLNGANPGGASGYLPRFAQPIGNSWTHPLLVPDKLMDASGGTPLLDHSFLLNLALSDHFYFSGLGDQTGSFGTGIKTSSLVSDFISGKPLVDPRLTLHTPDGKPATALSSEAAAAGAHTRMAAWQIMNGAFNINSTSVAAWKAMLGSIHDSQAVFNKINKPGKTSAFTNLPATDPGKNECRISRFRLPASESAQDGGDTAESYWLGAREYSDADLQNLAEKIVAQVRLRGPFLSMSEFVNRRLGTGETAQRGALQQAIDDSKLNDSPAIGANAGYQIPAAAVSTYKYANPEAGSGSSYQGGPGYLSQADLLTVLGNAATPRSDTFTIRGYGEARDASNRVTATAFCEAVVQRVPDYIDPTDKAEVAPASLTSKANRNFGRRIKMVSFRWLGLNEI